MDLKIKRILKIIAIIIFSSSQLPAISNYTFYSGAVASSVHELKSLIAVEINTDNTAFFIEQVASIKTSSSFFLNMNSGKTVRQNFLIFNSMTYETGNFTTMAYLLGQDLISDICSFKYRMGFQYGINKTFITSSTQFSVSPIFNIDLSFRIRNFYFGTALTGIKNDVSFFQTIPTLTPYIGFDMLGYRIKFEANITSSNYSTDRIYPVIALSCRVGFTYLRGARK